MTPSNPAGKITVVVVEDNADLRIALESILELDDEFSLVSTFENCEEASKGIPELHPNVVVMDINLGGMDGIDCVRNIKAEHPDILFLMCTVHEEDDMIFEALAAGANGYILKKAAAQTLAPAIKEVTKGGAPMSREIAARVIETFRKPENERNIQAEIQNLTSREIEVLDYLSKGLTYHEIAAQLFLGKETIRKYAYTIYDKLQVRNRMEAANKYFNRK